MRLLSLKGFEEAPVESIRKGDRIVVSKRIYTVTEAYQSAFTSKWVVNYEGNVYVDVPAGTTFLVKRK